MFQENFLSFYKSNFFSTQLVSGFFFLFFCLDRDWPILYWLSGDILRRSTSEIFFECVCFEGEGDLLTFSCRKLYFIFLAY